jgi:histidinol-phosphate aminotransferase
MSNNSNNSQNQVKSPQYIENLVPYKSGNSIGGKTSREDFKKLINLASNENPHGPSPMAVEAIAKAAKEVSIYPDVKSNDLVEKIAGQLDLLPTQVVCGHGSDSLIGYIVNAFSDIGDEILTAKGTFIGAYVNVNKLGRKLVTVPLKNYGFDFDAIEGAITPKTKIIYLANPNNPTGTMFSEKDFLKFFSRIPKHILILLDEAYYHYSYNFEGYPNGLKLFKEHGNNLLVIRTLSKHLGLAGVRVGFAFGDESLISTIYKVKLPFEPNTLAQVAAIAGLDDNEYVENAIETNAIAILKLKTTFDELGIEYVEPKANFVMILLKTDIQAQKFVEVCLSKNVITRYLGGFGIENGVRISTGTIEQTDLACYVFKETYELIKFII